jgi:hypothetical protein
MVVASAPIRVVNLLVPWLFKISSFKPSITPLNPPVRTVLLRMAWLRRIMTSLPCELALSYSDWVSRLNTGPPRPYTRYIYTIGWSTRRLRKHRSRGIMASNRTSHFSNCLAQGQGFASNGLAINAANLIDTTSVAFFSDMP